MAVEGDRDAQFGFVRGHSAFLRVVLYTLDKIVRGGELLLLSNNKIFYE